MLLALANLDTGLFFREKGWTRNLSLAKTFTDHAQVAGLAIQYKIKNAAVTMLDGDPPRAAGFLWISRPNQTRKSNANGG